MQRPWGSLFKKMCCAGVASVVAVLLVEVGLRLLAPSPFHELVPAFGKFTGLEELFEPDSLLVYRLKPRLSHSPVIDLRKVRACNFSVSTNALGLRGAEILPTHDHVRILALGDSCTFGFGVEDDETYPAQLERMLNRSDLSDRRFEVINAGVPGYRSTQGARYLAARGLELAPDVVIACFGNNESTSVGDVTKTDATILPYFSGGRVEDYLLTSRTYLGAKLGWISLRQRVLAPPTLIKQEPYCPRLSEREFRGELLKISRVCTEARVSLVLMIWPWRYQVRPVSRRAVPDDRFFRKARLVQDQAIIAEVAATHQHILVDLRRPFQNARSSIYLDALHGSTQALALTARLVLDAIRRTDLHTREPHEP
jgi:hypothetical protein